MTIDEFAAAKMEVLSRRLAYQITRARKQGDETSVHDLRVALRRFGQCLRVFRPVLSEHGSRKKRRRLRELLKRAGALRNFDVALQLLRESKCTDDNLRKRLTEERRVARKEFKCLV